MKRKAPLALWLVLGLCLTAVCAVLAELQKQPPSSNEIVGSWVGYEDGGVYFYRIALETNSAGSCVVLFNGESRDNYSIDFWRMADGKLILKLTAKSAAAEQIALTVLYIDKLRMELNVSGVTNNWKRKAVLYNEREFLRRANQTANSSRVQDRVGSR